MEDKTSEIISIIAAIIAALAGLFSYMSFRQAKRQADAVLGEVPANFGVYQNPSQPEITYARASFEILNHNRKALLINRIWLEKSVGVSITKDHKNTSDLVEDILDQVITGSTSYVFKIPLRLRGCGANTAPYDLIIPFNVKWENSGPKKPATLFFGCEYIYEGHGQTHYAYRALSIIPPPY